MNNKLEHLKKHRIYSSLGRIWRARFASNGSLGIRPAWIPCKRCRCSWWRRWYVRQRPLGQQMDQTDRRFQGNNKVSCTLYPTRVSYCRRYIWADRYNCDFTHESIRLFFNFLEDRERFSGPRWITDESCIFSIDSHVLRLDDETIDWKFGNRQIRKTMKHFHSVVATV